MHFKPKIQPNHNQMVSFFHTDYTPHLHFKHKSAYDF